MIATKFGMHDGDGDLKTAKQVEAGLHQSLRELRSEYIDIYQLHAVRPEHYALAVDHMLPILQRFQEQGKVRHIGLSEAFLADPAHEAASNAVTGGAWESLMIGFNLLNFSARREVLPSAVENGVGILCMFAVRRALTSLSQARELLTKAREEGQVPDSDEIDWENPLGFLLAETDCESLTEAAYRFARYEPGIDCVLCGTGSVDHLEQNVRDILKAPLPVEVLAKLNRLFGKVDTLTCH